MKTVSHAFIAMMAGLLRLTGTGRIDSISTDELLRSLERDEIVLVDVRSEAEQSVSTIPGAISKKAFEADLEAYRDRTVVPFCTVGGRAYLYSRKLSTHGFQTRCHRESILGWCDSELPLVDSRGEPTNRVHVVMSFFKVPPQYDAVTRP